MGNVESTIFKKSIYAHILIMCPCFKYILNIHPYFSQSGDLKIIIKMLLYFYILPFNYWTELRTNVL